MYEPDHPISSLVRLLGRENDVLLPGDFNKWDENGPKQLTMNSETGELEGLIGNNGWDFNKEALCKISIWSKSEFIKDKVVIEEGNKSSKIKLMIYFEENKKEKN